MMVMIRLVVWRMTSILMLVRVRVVIVRVIIIVAVRIIVTVVVVVILVRLRSGRISGIGVVIGIVVGLVGQFGPDVVEFFEKFFDIRSNPGQVVHVHFLVFGWLVLCFVIFHLMMTK